MSIGVVIKCLREEFPDVTVSKIRFLESEGLITPERTQSGYRRFTEADVERLRYILVTQRDNYLPLKVIREQLEAMDAGAAVAAVPEPALATPVASAASSSANQSTRLTDADIARVAGATEEHVTRCVEIGLIVPDASGLFSVDDARVVAAAHQLSENGFDARHFKSVRTAAQRQADFIAQVTGPVAKSGKATSRQQAEDMGEQMTALVAGLHAALIRAELRRSQGS